MNVAGYIRVSTEQQKKEGSHENQEETLEEWAEENDHSLELFRDIAISGQDDDREEYNDLMEEAEQYDAIVVRELSRFGRSLQKVLNDIDELNERDVGFISLKESMIDTTTADGQLFLQIIGAFNEYWANLARERANEMVERRREQGLHVGRPKKLDPDQLDQVHEWREMGLSYGGIATLVEDAYGISVDQSTIYRYCNETQEAAE